MSNRDPFIEQLRRLRSKLTDELADAVTVVGGTAPSLYSRIDRVGLRATQDIDLTITATTRTSWQLATHQFEECGFHSETDGPICRYSQDGVVIDIIPSDPTTIGFGPSQWMGKAADDRIYAGEVDLHVVEPRVFLALKAEAHADRGSGAPHPTSKDLEDVIVVLGNVDELASKLTGRAEPVDEFVDDFLRGVFGGASGAEDFCMYFPGDSSTQAFAEDLFALISERWT